MKTAALIVAAGRGERFGAALPKALVTLDGTPLVIHVLRRYLESGTVAQIVVAAPGGEVERFRSLIPDPAPVPVMVVAGGARRQDSVRLALAAVPEEMDLVSVHDAARPLVSVDLIRRTIEVAARQGAAVAALPVSDSVKEVDDRGVVMASRARDRLWLAQTPQVFRADWLREAHRLAERESIEATDDSALVERLGVSVAVVPGEPVNLKITRAEDLRLAEAWLRAPRG